MNGGRGEILDARPGTAFLRAPSWRFPGRIALLLGTAASLLIAVLVVYQGRVSFSALGVDFRASEPFRALALASMGLLGLSWMRHGRVHRDLLVLLLCANAYALNFGVVPSGDVIPAQYAALSLVEGRGTSLDGYPELVQRGTPYYLVRTPSGLRSSFPIGPALLSWPLFLPAAFMEAPSPELLDRVGDLAALVLGVLAVWFVLVLARRSSSSFSPHWIALAYGLGTSHWAISSVTLWQHGPGELMVLGSMERVLDGETPLARRLFAAGAALALAVFTRPSLIVAVPVLVGLAIGKYGHESFKISLGAAALGLPLAYFHLHIYGHWLGPYAAQTHAIGFHSVPASLRSAGLLLLSPSRGVLWFEPVVPFTLALALFSVRGAKKIPLIAGMMGLAALLILYAHHSPWWGGHTVGPRYLTDALPFWALAVASMGPCSRMAGRLALLFVGFGFAVNVTGTTRWAGHWNASPSVDEYPQRLETWDDSQLLFQFLTSLPGERHLREAVDAENQGALGRALALWRVERVKRPWNRHAARKEIDLLIRTDQLREAVEQARRRTEDWPGDPYFEHESLRLPAIRDMLDEQDWARPSWARASPNTDLAPLVLDGSLGTSWSTVWLQKKGDWIEVGADCESRVRGVALFYAPQFGEGPASLSVAGVREDGLSVLLGELGSVRAERKGWIVIRFPPTRLASIRLTIPSGAPRRLSISEIRLLTS